MYQTHLTEPNRPTSSEQTGAISYIGRSYISNCPSYFPITTTPIFSEFVDEVYSNPAKSLRKMGRLG